MTSSLKVEASKYLARFGSGVDELELATYHGRKMNFRIRY